MQIRLMLGGVAAAAVLAVIPMLPAGNGRVAAQKGGGGMTGGGSTESAVMSFDRPRAMTPFETFADKLGLDEKTQLPQVREIVTAASAEAAAPARELLQLRQKLLNLELNAQSAEMQATRDAYATAAAKVTGIEASAMTKIVPLLKPNQMSKIPQAFAALQGMFQIGTPAGRGGRGRG